MNTWQACRRVKNILRGVQWGGSGGRLFANGSVFASGGPVDDLLSQMRVPAAFVNAGSSRHDPHQPGLYESDMEVVTLVRIAGDVYGERVLMGANRASKTESTGRGLFEVEAEMLSNMLHLDAAKQFRLMLKAQSSVIAANVGDAGFFATRRYIFSTLLTVEYQHMHPRVVTLAEAAGTVTVSWLVPDVATNLVSYVVRRTAGTIPAAFPTDGTDVPWTSGLSTTDAPGAGEYTYSVFATYDDQGGAVALAVSDYSDARIEFS